MDTKYWIDFWKNYGVASNSRDPQTQVLRTLHKNPISNELWEFTLEKIDETFTVNKDDKILDLCCGNGLLSKHFVAKGAKVVAVDVSEELLSQMNGVEEIQTIYSDIRDLNFENDFFDKVIIYAGIQYLNNKESVQLLKRIYNWVKPGGTVFIGDIPDISKLWNFYDSEERKRVYFENVLNDTAIIGYWYDKNWLESLTSFIGFEEGVTITQDSKLINSNFRYDFLYTKK